jgi:class 3 adenylate cyclase/YHS domain-containing protein
MTSGEWTFAFVDLAGFTALTEAHGDESAALQAARFFQLTRASLGGTSRLVKEIGDAVLLASDAPEDAVSTVQALVSAVDREDHFPLVRAGIHTGSAVRSRSNRGVDDYLGSGVNLAARVAGHASGRQVLLTQAVARRLDGVKWPLRPLGHMQFRSVAQPIDVFELMVLGEQEGDVDPVCRMQVPPGAVVASLRHGGRDFTFCSLECVATFADNPDYYALPEGEPRDP